RNRIMGWRTGRGNNRVDWRDGNVELRLDGRLQRLHNLSSTHAHFFFNEQGVFCIATLKDGAPMAVAGAGDPKITFAVNPEHTRVDLGEYSYNLTLTEHSRSPGFMGELVEWFESTSLSPSVSPTPTLLDTTIGKWSISPTFAGGGSGSVSVAKRLDSGDVV